MSHCSNPWWGQALINSLYLSHPSKSDSPSVCLKQVIWFLSWAVLLGGKYLARNAFFNSFHVVMEFDGRDCSQALALSLREKGNKRRRMASGSTPLHLSVSANCTNTERCKFGSSVGLPEKWFCCMICSREGFNSKLLAWIVGLTILEWGSSWDGTEKSLRGRFAFWAYAIWAWIRSTWRLMCKKHSISSIGSTRSSSEVRVLGI